MRRLSKEEADRKCLLGQGTAGCSYLAKDAGGFFCAFVDVWLRAALNARRVAGTIKPRGGPCTDPFDVVSIAARVETP